MPVERIIIDWTCDESSREDFRSAVLMKWLQEQHGSADAFQRYRYNVEKLPNGSMVYLHRPAFMNKGCDFIVNCEPAIPRDDGKKFKNPRHKDLIDELKRISNNIGDGHTKILPAVEAVWLCEDLTEICDSICSTITQPEWAFRTERALKVAKWLFIEQDITDWNTSGRAMLMNGIKEALGGLKK